jgi:hypothetical protein
LKDYQSLGVEEWAVGIALFGLLVIVVTIAQFHESGRQSTNASSPLPNRISLREYERILR